MSARIILISGSPGTGKTSVSQILSEQSASDRAVLIHVDDFWQCICKGYVYPWLENAGIQNDAVIEAVAASAKIFAENGYEVYVEGTIGPWYLEPWEKMAEGGIDVRYVILRPDEDAAVSRAAARRQREHFPLGVDIIRGVWRSFNNLGRYESHVVDTTGQTVDESAAVVQKRLAEKGFCLM